MAVGAADVRRDCVGFDGATEGFRAGVDVPDASFLGGSLGGLRLSSETSALEAAAEGLRGAVEGLRSVSATAPLSSLSFDGSLGGCFFGLEVPGPGCDFGSSDFDSSDFGLGGSLVGCFFGASLVVSFAGCLGASFLGAFFSGAFLSSVAFGFEAESGSFDVVDFVTFFSGAFFSSVAVGFDLVSEVFDGMGLGAFLGAAVDFAVVLWAGEASVFFGPNFGGFFFGVSDMAVADAAVDRSRTMRLCFLVAEGVCPKCRSGWCTRRHHPLIASPRSRKSSDASGP